MEPDLLLMDEPFSHLDAITARGLREQLQEIWTQTKKTVLFVTHDITEAALLSNRVLMLAPGGRLYADEQRGLNRAENLRAIPPSDPDFHWLFRRRNDAESLNRGIEDSLYWTRSHSVGAVAQEADLLGFALGLNALSRYRHRKREAARAAPAAA